MGCLEVQKVKIGLIDVDGHHFPNLALMRLSTYHKSRGDTVEWWWGWEHYDVVYKSKVFSDTYTQDIPDPVNADIVIKGGTGYAIKTKNEIETYDKALDPDLPPEIERMIPDSSIYPKYSYCITMTSRGCPRGCPWCHVGAKEGKQAYKTGNLYDYYQGQKEIVSLDANLTACPDKRDLFDQYAETGALVDFSQGLDIRLLNGYDIDALNRMRIKQLHFAWDNPHEDLKSRFADYAKAARHKPHGAYASVYILTNYNSTMEENLERIYTLRDMEYDPDVRIYNKSHAPYELLRLQRWCNNRYIFKKCRRFEDYYD